MLSMHRKFKTKQTQIAVTIVAEGLCIYYIREFRE